MLVVRRGSDVRGRFACAGGRVYVSISVTPSTAVDPLACSHPTFLLEQQFLLVQGCGGAGGVSGSLCQRRATGGENCVEFFTASGPGDRTDRNSTHRRGLFDFPPTPTVF